MKTACKQRMEMYMSVIFYFISKKSCIPLHLNCEIKHKRILLDYKFRSRTKSIVSIVSNRFTRVSLAWGQTVPFSVQTVDGHYNCCNCDYNFETLNERRKSHFDNNAVTFEIITNSPSVILIFSENPSRNQSANQRWWMTCVECIVKYKYSSGIHRQSTLEDGGAVCDLIKWICDTN